MKARILTLTLTALVIMLCPIVYAGDPPELLIIPKLGDDVNAVCYSPDGKRLAAGIYDEVSIWDVSTGQLLHTFKNKGHVTVLSYSPDGRRLASVGREGRTVRVWDASTGKLLRVFRRNRTEVSTVSYSPDGRRLASGGDHVDEGDARVWIWDASTGKLLHILKGQKYSRVTALSYSPDGRRLASGSTDEVRIWDASTGKLLHTLTGSVKALSYSPNGRRLASGGGDERVRIWDASTGKLLHTLKGHTGSVIALSYSPDGRRLASGSTDERVRIWDASTGKLLHILRGHERITEISYSPDGSTLAASEIYGRVRVWNMTSVELQVLKKKKKAREQQLFAEKQQELQGLFTPKGEFETTTEYQTRMAQAKSLKPEIEQRYAAKLKAEWARIDQEVEEFLASTVTEIMLSVENIGTYDADRGTFSVTIHGQTENIKVPRGSARSFKENKGKLVVKGEKELTEEGRWSYYNLMIENPATGNRYAFGPQTERRVAITKKIIPPKLVARRPQFLEPSGNGFLDAEEEGKVVLTVENKGEGSAYSLLVQLSAQGSVPHITYDRERIISEIRPGARETVKFSLRAGSSVADGQYSFVLKMKEANGFEPEDVPFSIQTRHLIPPDLQVVDIGVRDASQNSKIEPGELASITVRVQNRGKGEAKAVQAQVVLGDNVFFTQESQKQFDLGNIPAGAYKDVVFSLYTNNRIKDQIPVSLRLTEQRDRFSKRVPFEGALALYVNRVQKRPEEIVFVGREEPEVKIKDVATLSVDIEQDIPKTKTRNPNAVAVVIGNQHYKHIGNVDYANRDATVMRDYLEQTFGYKAGNILRYSDATKTDFEALFGSNTNHKGKLYRKTRSGGEVFIYYSGHGHSEGPDKPSYFVPADAEVSTIGLTGYPLKVFYDNIARLIEEKHPKRVVVVIESCFSGYLAEGISSTRWVSDNPLMTLKSSGAVVMTAASGRETAKWYKAEQHGLFTYFLLKAFQNSPNEAGKRADANGDGRLTLREIQAFVGDRNYGVPYFAPLQTGDEQTPVIMGDKTTVLLEW